MHDRNGRPDKGFAAVITAAGTRTWASTEEADVLQSMLAEEWVGRGVDVHADGHLTPA